MAALTLGLTAGSIISGMIGKDIDYPWLQGTYQVVDGVAQQVGEIQTLDKGHKINGQGLLDATIAAVNTALKGLGIYGQKGATYATQPIGVVAGDRPGAVDGGFYTGFEADKSKTNSKFLGGIRQDSTGFGTADRAIEAAVKNQVQSIYDSGGSAVRSQIDQTGGAEGMAAATSVASGLDIDVPSKFKASNFWTKLSKGLKYAAMASGAYDIGTGVSEWAARGAEGGMSAAGEFSTTAGEGLGFSNADIAANAFGTGTTMSAANTAVDGLGSGLVSGLGSGLDFGAGAFNLGAPGISAAAEGVLGLGADTWSGLNAAGPGNVGFSAVPELGSINQAGEFVTSLPDSPLTPGSPGIPAGTTELGGEFVTGLPGGGGSITVPDIGAPGLDDAVTNVVDNAIAGIGPNSADVINSIPGSNPAPPGSGGSRWDTLTDAAKAPFLDPDGTVNWSRVAQAGLLGANVLGGALGGSPGGGVLTGGSNYVAPDWVSGGIPDSPDPGQYMQRGGEWTPGMTVNEQAELLARGVAAPKDYTQNEGSRRMTRDPSLATLPTRSPPGAGVPGSPVGGGAVRGRGSPGLRVGPPPVGGVPGSPATPAPESNIPANVASALRGERGFDPEITSFLQRAHSQADSGLPFADWIGTIAASRGGTVPTNFDFLGAQPSPPPVGGVLESPATGGMMVTTSDVGPNGESVTMTAAEARERMKGYQPQTQAVPFAATRPVGGGAPAPPPPPVGGGQEGFGGRGGWGVLSNYVPPTPAPTPQVGGGRGAWGGFGGFSGGGNAQPAPAPVQPPQAPPGNFGGWGGGNWGNYATPGPLSIRAPGQASSSGTLGEQPTGGMMVTRSDTGESMTAEEWAARHAGYQPQTSPVPFAATSPVGGGAVMHRSPGLLSPAHQGALREFFRRKPTKKQYKLAKNNAMRQMNYGGY